MPDGATNAAVQIPNLVKDPTWSLQPWPLEIVLDRTHVVYIEPIPAAEWLKYLLRPEPDILSLVWDLMPEVEDYIFENELSEHELMAIVLDVIATVSGRDWWVALRLIALAAAKWHVIGPGMVAAGADPSTMSIGLWLDIALSVTMEIVDPDHATMFTLQLEAEPKLPINGSSEQEPESDQAGLLPMPTDRSAFLAFAR